MAPTTEILEELRVLLGGFVKKHNLSDYQLEELLMYMRCGSIFLQMEKLVDAYTKYKGKK